MRLLTPLDTPRLTMPNRIVMAPMTRYRARPDGAPESFVATYYAQRAEAGLIVTEGLWPHRSGQSEFRLPGIETEEHVNAWRDVTTAVHDAGGRIFAQLMHGGRKGHPQLLGGDVPAGPSAVLDTAWIHVPDGTKLAPVLPRALGLAEIPAVVEQFAAAARNAIASGFDGVEIHGANSYLVHQFLADNTNHRTDRYGGTVTNRIRFALDVVAAISDAIGAGRTALRLSPGNPQFGMVELDPAPVYRALVSALADFDLAYLHLTDNDGYAALDDLRTRWPGTLVANIGENRERTEAVAAERVLHAGLADAVSFGRAFIANPDLVTRIVAGLPLAKVDDATIYGPAECGYTDYPTATRDAEGVGDDPYSHAPVAVGTPALH